MYFQIHGTDCTNAMYFGSLLRNSSAPTSRYVWRPVVYERLTPMMKLAGKPGSFNFAFQRQLSTSMEARQLSAESIGGKRANTGATSGPILYSVSSMFHSCSIVSIICDVRSHRNAAPGSNRSLLGNP